MSIEFKKDDVVEIISGGGFVTPDWIGIRGRVTGADGWTGKDVWIEPLTERPDGDQLREFLWLKSGLELVARGVDLGQENVAVEGDARRDLEALQGEFEAFKRKVRDLATERVRSDRDCENGMNEALAELGLQPVDLHREYTVTITLRVPATDKWDAEDIVADRLLDVPGLAHASFAVELED
jgi:hypothetical protein